MWRESALSLLQIFTLLVPFSKIALVYSGNPWTSFVVYTFDSSIYICQVARHMHTTCMCFQAIASIFKLLLKLPFSPFFFFFFNFILFYFFFLSAVSEDNDIYSKTCWPQELVNNASLNDFVIKYLKCYCSFFKRIGEHANELLDIKVTA